MLQESYYEIIFNSRIEILKNDRALNGGIRGRILNEVIHEKMNSERKISMIGEVMHHI